MNGKDTYRGIVRRSGPDSEVTDSPALRAISEAVTAAPTTAVSTSRFSAPSKKCIPPWEEDEDEEAVLLSSPELSVSELLELPSKMEAAGDCCDWDIIRAHYSERPSRRFDGAVTEPW
ncbi:hypothetical protein TYRP_001833 [Tyrophagus putrescentiae]|nr:hypothetical protein TYRP_001833 [Tyrophagus putrescentiae]